MNIADLNLSPHIIIFLQKNQFLTTESLEGKDYYTLSKLTANFWLLSETMMELNALGYLLPSNHEQSLVTLPMSTRLKNSLHNNGLFYLSELQFYTREEVLQFRNTGVQTLAELEQLCAQKDVQFYQFPNCPDPWKRKTFFWSFKKAFSRAQVKSFEEFNHKTVYELYLICDKNFSLTREVYYLFQKYGICFLPSAEAFTFEFMSETNSKKIYSTFKMTQMKDLIKIDFTKFNSRRNYMQNIIESTLVEYQHSFEVS